MSAQMTACQWAGVDHSGPATVTLVLIRPCGHQQMQVPTCAAHATEYPIGCSAARATICSGLADEAQVVFCDEVNRPTIARQDPLP